MTVYSLDTSFFMDWQARYYPLDVFQSLEQKIEAMIEAGTCQACGVFTLPVPLNNPAVHPLFCCQITDQSALAATINTRGKSRKATRRCECRYRRCLVLRNSCAPLWHLISGMTLGYLRTRR